ncbi:hypothetical protein HQ533_01805 [Candidatus Woesearchaeota archaeon]|nr:hypothetical protein [Candidatus Woesearchaeota archaeon]
MSADISMENKGLALLSREKPYTTQSAIYYKDEVAKIDDLSAISFELDVVFQSVLDYFSTQNVKFNFESFPGFAYAMNYGANHDIPLYAFDEYLSEYNRRVQEIDHLLKSAARTVGDAKILSLVKTLGVEYDGLDEKRSQSLASRLTELSQDVSGIVAHLCSETQERKIKKFI